MEKRTTFFLLCILVSPGLVSGQTGASFLVSPENVAGMIGEMVRFNVTVRMNDETGLSWYQGESADVIWNSAQSSLLPMRGYEIEDEDQGSDMFSYDLVIPSLSKDKALYHVIRGNNFNREDQYHRGAYITALEKASCETSHDQNVNENTAVTLTCEVKYYGDMVPRFRWSNEEDGEFGSGADVPIDDPDPDFDGRKIVRYSRVLNTRKYHHDIEQLCEVMFADGSLPADRSDQASDAFPGYHDHCRVILKVEFDVEDVQIYPGPGSDDIVTVQAGDALYCNASGNPTPNDYSWSCDGLTAGERSGQGLIIEDSWETGVEYTCTCTARQSGRSATGQVRFRVSGGGTEAVEKSGTSGGVIAAVVIVVILVIIVVIIVIICCLRKRKQQPDKPSGGGGGGADNVNDGYQPSMVDLHKQPVSPYPQGPPPNLSSTGNGLPVKGSPGMADLGVKHISASNPSLNASFNTLDRSRDYPPQPMSYPPQYNGDTTV